MYLFIILAIIIIILLLLHTRKEKYTKYTKHYMSLYDNTPIWYRYPSMYTPYFVSPTVEYPFNDFVKKYKYYWK